MVEDGGQKEQIKVLLARVDELESRTVLGDLVSDYCRGFDKGDWSLFRSVWHDDATWEPGAGVDPVKGTEAIRAAAETMREASWRTSHHLTSNLKVVFDDLDHAHGTCNLDCTGITPDGIAVVVRATYHDSFERRDRAWKIAKRRMELHFFQQISGAN